MIDLSLGYTPVGLIRSPRASEVAVLSQESPSLYFYTLSSSGSFTQHDIVSLSKPCRDVATQSYAPQRQDELALLSTDGTTALILKKVADAFTETALNLGTSSQRIAYGDINSDKRVDILLFGKKRVGVSTLMRQKDGKWAEGSLIFPDVSISDLQCTDLNGDGITDIFVLNWLTNQLELFYGIGHGVFSEQVEVTLPGEPMNIAISPVSKERTLHIAVSIPEELLVATFQCNATGEIESTGALRLPSPPLHVQFADLNDKSPDIVVTTEQAAYVFQGKTDMQYAQPIVFGPGDGVVASDVADLDGDLKPDLILIDRDNRRLVAYGNASGSGQVQWPATYSVGMNPQGIAVLDLNNDGLPDLAVANSGSSSLSILLNQGEGKFAGQQVLPVAEKPVTVKALPRRSDQERTLVTSHATVDRISIVGLNDKATPTNISSIPTVSNPYVVFARQDSMSGQLEILARQGSSRNSSLSLSLFQQISGGQFLEKSLRASLPGRITALTVDDYSGSGKYELVFATYDKPTRQTTLSIAFATQGFDFKTIRTILSFPDSTASVHAIITGYVDDDRYKDIVLLMSAPRSSLGVVFGKGGEAFRDSVEIIRGVQPLKEDAVLLQDVNGDGHTDLTWIDAGRGAVVTSYGRGDRRFDPPVNVCPASRITAIQIAAMKVPTIQDLILTNGVTGSITIMFDPFR